MIEVRANEFATRDVNPHVPFLPHEIAADARACHDAGAAVFHFHGRGADGAADNSVSTCLETVRAVRAAAPVLVHPTLGFFAHDANAETRFAPVAAAMRSESTRVDLAPLDMGSVNFDRFDADARRFETVDRVYRNPTGTLIALAGRMRAIGVAPYCVAWNVSFLRLVDALMETGTVPEPAWLCLCMTEGVLAGHPGTAAGLDAHLACLPQRRLGWTALVYGGSVLALADRIIAKGGHISLGLGDHPHAEDGLPTNAALVERVVAMARAQGREPASVEEARGIVGAASSH